MQPHPCRISFLWSILVQTTAMKSISCLILLCLVLCSCKKDKAKEPSRSDLITSSTWKYNDGGIDQDRNGAYEISFESTGYVQPCALDNTGTFFTGGSGTADEGPTKCNVSFPQTTPFSWAFADNETTINIYGNGLFGLGGHFRILELSSTKMSLSKD